MEYVDRRHGYHAFLDQLSRWWTDRDLRHRYKLQYFRISRFAWLIVGVAARELKAHRLHITLLNVQNELCMREVVYEAFAVVHGQFRVERKQCVIFLPLVVRLAADARSLARVADIAGFREMYEQFLLRLTRSDITRGLRLLYVR